MSYEPLASILRPTTLDGFVGQKHILGEEKLLRLMIESDMVRSIILFGPPGTGKTTLSHIIADRTSSKFMSINASADGAKIIKDVIKQARIDKDVNKQTTIVATDEIHRHPKNVQDLYLPAVENGTIILVGMTTQNPYFSLVPALISRSQLFEFKPLETQDLLLLMVRGVEYYRKERNLNVEVDSDCALYLARKSNGDTRKILNALEILVESHKSQKHITITIDMCKEVLPQKSVVFDRSGDEHYDFLSAIQNAVQFSDVDGAIFWLAQAINSGEDVQVICRRLLVTAAEDVGTSNPLALIYTYAAVESATRVGFPEASLILSSAVAFLAMNKRSKASARAIWKALKMDDEELVKIPDGIKDCHYRGSKELGRGGCHDGQFLEEYEKVINGLFVPENGVEIDYMKENLQMWVERKHKMKDK